MENVPALLAKRHKSNFEEWISVLQELGYYSKYFLLNAFDFGLASKSIECIDGLAILEYVDYSTIGGGAKKVVNVYDIIKQCLVKSNLTYNYLYISNNVKVDNT